MSLSVLGQETEKLQGSAWSFSEMRSGRFELPRVAPLPPQSSVSTNSTTTAKCLSEPLLTRRLRNAWDSGNATRNDGPLRSSHIAKDLRRTFRLDGLLDRRPAGLLSDMKTGNHQIDAEHHHDQTHSPPFGQLGYERIGTSAGERLASASTAERAGKAAGFVVLHQDEADEDHAPEYVNENQSPEKEVHWVRKNRVSVFL